MAWDAWGEDEEQGSEDDDVSEPDFEPESMGVEESLGSSVDDFDVHAALGRRLRGEKLLSHMVAVYSGPQLCCEDEDFDDD